MSNCRDSCGASRQALSVALTRPVGDVDRRVPVVAGLAGPQRDLPAAAVLGLVLDLRVVLLVVGALHREAGRLEAALVRVEGGVEIVGAEAVDDDGGAVLGGLHVG